VRSAAQQDGVDVDDVNNPGCANITFDQIAASYAEGDQRADRCGADLLLFETITDTLTPSRIFAAQKISPSAVSSAGDDPGTTPTSPPHPLGADTECVLVLRAACPAVHDRAQLCARRQRHAAAHRRAHAMSPIRSSQPYPNAGLPNEFGGYDESPEFMARQIETFAREAWSTSSAAAAARRPIISAPSRRSPARHKPRAIPTIPPLLPLSALEPFTADQGKSRS